MTTNSINSYSLTSVFLLWTPTTAAKQQNNTTTSKEDDNKRHKIRNNIYESSGLGEGEREGFN